MKANRYFEDEELKAKFNKKAFKKTIKYAVPYKKILIPLSIMLFVMSFITLLPSLINKFIIDDVIQGTTGIFGFDRDQSAVILVTAIAIIGIGDILFAYFRTFYMSKIGHNMVRDIRNATFKKLQTLSLDYYDKRPAGKILVRITTYLDELASVFSEVFVNLIADSLKIIVITILLFILNYVLALVVLAVVVPMSVLLVLLRSGLTKRQRVVRNAMSNRTAFVAENVQGRNTARAYNKASESGEVSDGLNKRYAKSYSRFLRLNELYYPLTDGFFYVGLIAVYGTIVFLALSSYDISGLSLGTVISFITYMGMYSAPLNNIATSVQLVVTATSNLERVYEVCQAEPSIKDTVDAVEIDNIVGNVKFNNVSFGYDSDKLVLHDISLDVPQGKCIALVGPTGAGKSSIVNLIGRFYDVSSGEITIDGLDVRDIKQESLRSHIGMMMQECFIFAGTIIDNIRLACPNATDEQVRKASVLVGADSFITERKDGYNTRVVAGGESLSQGEKQLISLARLMLADPKIVILDEATSSIDTSTEEIIKKAIDSLTHTRTSFIVAHRLSTIKKADCILYIDNGTIAESGTHTQLMEQKGKYYNLVMRKKSIE